jgi:hypothetical protein
MKTSAELADVFCLKNPWQACLPKDSKTKNKAVCKTAGCFHSQNGAFEDHREVILATPLDIADNPYRLADGRMFSFSKWSLRGSPRGNPGNAIGYRR